MTRPWTGEWVHRELDVAVTTTTGVGGLTVPDLVGMAVRVNPRRVHLLVSRVLGKHVPVDPDVVRGAGLLLGRLVADRLTGQDDGTARTAGELLASALRDGDAGAADRVLALLDRPDERLRPDVLVLGYAETATGLGHLVADALDADVLHSTRRPVGRAAGSFEEAHSHATGHLLLPEDPALLAGDRPVVLVDDELSTGATVIDTIRGIQAIAPRRRWIVAGLVDLRTDAARAELDRFAAGLGIEVEVVALVSGTVLLPADVLARGADLVARRPAGPAVPTRTGAPVHEVPAGTVAGFRDGGRHGFTRAHRTAVTASVPGMAAQVLEVLGPQPGRVLVLGTEELMHLPLLVAGELSRLGVDVAFSSTTRSPVLPVDDPGYAIRTALRFDSHDRPADGPGPRFAYNVAAPAGGEPYGAAVLVVDDAGREWADGPTAPPSVVAAAVAGPVVVLTVPSHRPTPEPLRGPAFGSYAPDEVGWLLTDLSDVALEAPVATRERAIQSGRAHYSESLPVEYQPGPAYLELFEQALAASASRLAAAVGVVTELVLAQRSGPPVLVSLARAGTPIGVLMRRWGARRGLDLPHLTVSIVRGRGLDPRALDHLAAHHDPADVVFVDGWTGKGAITRELQAAVQAAEDQQARGFRPDLAVVADPGACTTLFGTREDFLIPSACLNSTVSGLVSRTVLRADLVPPGGYHGAKFYRELAEQDVSGRFLDTVSACFDAVADDVAATLATPRDRTPTWSGWSAVAEVARDVGIDDLNLVKPGVGETTRVLLRRVPWQVLVRPDRTAELAHVLHLAQDRGVEVHERADMPFSCIGLIRPGGQGPG